MELTNKVIVITGAGGGIGRAMALRFAAERPYKIICADLDLAGAQTTANQIGGVALKLDVAVEAEIATLIETIETNIGPIDLFCSNAGISVGGGVEVPDDDWQRTWQVNVMAHVWAARHLLPRMTARGDGYLLNTASAAGLLNQVGDAPLWGEQTRRRGPGGMAGNEPRRRRHQGFGVVPTGRAHRDDARS